MGRYNEFDQLRRAGVQHADIKGYQFSREDVDAQSLANLYAQYMGNVFTHEMKPLEIEILVAEVGTEPGGDQLFHILYDGSVVDEERFTVLGGEADAIAARMDERFADGWDMAAALSAAVGALSADGPGLGAGDLEVALLARHNGRRTFQRLRASEVGELLGADAPPAADGGGGEEAGDGDGNGGEVDGAEASTEDDTE